MENYVVFEFSGPLQNCENIDLRVSCTEFFDNVHNIAIWREPGAAVCDILLMTHCSRQYTAAITK